MEQMNYLFVIKIYFQFRFNKMNANFFAGCEGGASHSTMVIVNDCGKVIAEIEGEGTNHWLIGVNLNLKK